MKQLTFMGKPKSLYQTTLNSDSAKFKKKLFKIFGEKDKILIP